jgi:hypothetical protein
MVILYSDVNLRVLHVYLHREPHCSGPFDMQLVYEDMPQESGSYQCRAAHIRAERLISVQTDVQADIAMDTDMGVRSVYIRAFRPREISQSTSLSSIQSNSVLSVPNKSHP